MSVSAGTRLGAYEILSLLGSGGMGEVYRAHDGQIKKRDIALKVLQTNDEDHKRRLEREAHTIAALNHPNIVTIHSVEDVGGTPFLDDGAGRGRAAELALIPPGGMPLEETLQNLAIQIAEALAAAHKKGIIHRDLKPENLFITRSGARQDSRLWSGKANVPEGALRPGIDNEASTIRGKTKPGVIMGTVGYMSPEQVRGEDADYRSDIFSLSARSSTRCSPASAPFSGSIDACRDAERDPARTSRSRCPERVDAVSRPRA